MADTLVVVAAHGDDYLSNWEGDMLYDVVMWDTSEGGHPTRAYIEAFRQYRDRYQSFMFVQDSMRPTDRRYLQQFRIDRPVVAWCTFPGMMWDSDGQAEWVRTQYPDQLEPANGIFGPVFYATRDAMQQAEPHFPATPRTKLEAQGTERAWAYCFQAAGVPVFGLYTFDVTPMQNGDYAPFVKVFANRQ